MRVVAAVVMLLVFSARAEPIASGLVWLRAQQGPTGLEGEARGEEPVIATSEAVGTWMAISLEGQQVKEESWF